MVVQKAKVHFDSSCHGHELAVFHAGSEFPVADGLDGLFVKAVPQTSYHPNMTRMTGRIHLYIENHSTLKFFLERFF